MRGVRPFVKDLTADGSDGGSRVPFGLECETHSDDFQRIGKEDRDNAG